MIVASVVGSFVMADIVTKFDRKKVRYALFVGLFILATVILMKVFAIGPFGTIGTELGLRGAKLVIAVVGNFIFGALMSIGVGLYAPCMAMVLALGMDAGCAFPAMMGSCAYLMAFGNGPKFIAQGRYDMVACWTQAIFGAIGVYCALRFRIQSAVGYTDQGYRCYRLHHSVPVSARRYQERFCSVSRLIKTS